MASVNKRPRSDSPSGSDSPTKGTSQEAPKTSGHAEEYSRVSKNDLYMMIALLMENYVDAEAPKGYHKVGAVLVLPNDIVQAADCSRDGVHAVVRLLMKHNNKTEGCKMFISRKPCPMCAKLLVQSKVNRVFFLPFEPEYYPSHEKRDSMMTEVDNLFTASSIAQTRFVLHVDAQVIEDSAKKQEIKDAYGNVTDKLDMVNEETHELDKKYGFESCAEWKDDIKEKLPWSGFDKEIEAMFQIYFTNAMKLIARAKILRGSGSNYTLEKAK